MATRGNIVIQERDGGEVFLYQHWDAYELPAILAKALDRGRNRWDDEAYLARVIFSEMVKGDIDGETGYGISTYEGDGGVNLRVNVLARTVLYEGSEFRFDDFVKRFKR